MCPVNGHHPLKLLASLKVFPEIAPGHSRLASDIDLCGPIARLDRDFSDFMRQA
jgi:hypothetical protein